MSSHWEQWEGLLGKISKLIIPIGLPIYILSDSLTNVSLYPLKTEKKNPANHVNPVNPVEKVPRHVGAKFSVSGSSERDESTN